jgi:RNA polymerase sigma factor for flagellar operon FliA
MEAHSHARRPVIPRAYRAAGEPSPRLQSREEICAAYQARVLAIARRVYEHVACDEAGMTLEDLAAHGAIGLLEAYERYDTSHGVGFSEFAEFRIRGAMLDALRTMDTFTRRRHQASRRLRDATTGAAAALGGAPGAAEIARFMGVELEEYWRTRDAASPVVMVSVEAATDADGSIRHALLPEVGNVAPVRMAVEEARAALRQAIAALPERERQVVLLYYGRDLNLAEVGETLGVTPSRVCQVLSAARGKLRTALAAAVDPSCIAEEGAA